MKLKPPVGGSKSLLISDSLRLNRNHLKVDSFRNETSSCSSETQNSAVAVFGIIFVGEKEQKQAIWCLKRKSLKINFLFIELLYKINITFNHAYFWRKKKTQHSSCDINYMKLYFCPHILNFGIILNAF